MDQNVEEGTATRGNRRPRRVTVYWRAQRLCDVSRRQQWIPLYAAPLQSPSALIQTFGSLSGTILCLPEPVNSRHPSQRPRKQRLKRRSSSLLPNECAPCTNYGKSWCPRKRMYWLQIGGILRCISLQYLLICEASTPARLHSAVSSVEPNAD